MQQITIDGYLSKDAETRQVGDQTVTTWNIPVKQGFGDREKTNWFRVNIWGKRADYASRATKGEYAIASGELTIGEYNGKPTLDIRAAEFRSVKTAPRSPDGSQGAPLDQTRKSFPDAQMVDDLEDSIPFATNAGIW